MSWLYSRALVEAFSEASCSDGARSALLSGSHTPQAFLPNDKTMDFSRLSRFGMTFAPLTDTLGAEVLTWFLAGSPARTSALQEKAQASKASVPACGSTWRASLARFDPATSSWKTAQHSLLVDSEECSVTWPRSGMTAGGECWELPMLEPLTSATASGLWPTPTVCGNHNRKGASPTSGDGLATAVKKWPTPTCPRANDSDNTAGKYYPTKNQFDLAAAVVKWATPICRDSRTVKGGGANDECTWQRAADYASSSSGGRDGWRTEPDVGRMAHGVAARVDRLKAIGNGQVPLCAAYAFTQLARAFDE